MVEDEALRSNRLALLRDLRDSDEPRRRHLEARGMKLVILDRDGTINHDSDQYIKSPPEWKPIPGSLEAIARLTQAGWRVRGGDQPVGHRARAVRHGDAERDPRQDAPRASARRAGASTRSSSARTRPTRTASAASPSPACCARSAQRFDVGARGRADGRRLAARPAGRRRGRRASRSWCSPARARRRATPAACRRAREVFADLAAFAAQLAP